MIPIIFVSAPYRGGDQNTVRRNIRRAEAMAEAVAEAGGYPVAPNMCTAWFEGIQPDEFWLSACLRLVRKADGVLAYRRPGERFSAGVQAEWNEALRLGIPAKQVCYPDHFREIAEVLIGQVKAELTGERPEYELDPPA